MKLILCKKCSDIVSLRREPRTCFCGAAGGQYKEDGLHSVIWGESVPLGILNDTFIEALRDQPESGLGTEFKAFVIPKKASTIEYVPVPLSFILNQRRLT